MKRRILAGLSLLLAAVLTAGGCGGGGGGGTAVPSDKATATTSTTENGATATETTVSLANAVAVIPSQTVLTDMDGDPVTGIITATVYYSDELADLQPNARALPSGTDLAGFVDIVVQNAEGAVVKYLSNPMNIAIRLPGTEPGENLIHYSYNGVDWIAEDPATVKPDGTVDVLVSHLSLHAFLKCIIKDTTPPTVILRNPAPNEVNVSGNSKILAVFSEPMDPASITNSTFIVKKQDGTLVSGIVQYDPVTNSALFKPDAVLTPMTTFVAKLTIGCKDMAGNALTSDVEWTFEKEWKLDQTRPTVRSTVPDSEAVSVAIDTKLTISFDEQMDPLTVGQNLITDLSGGLTYSPVKNEAYFKPDCPLTPGKRYCFTVRDKAKDLAGNILVPYSWCFTTFVPTGSGGSSGF